MSIKAFGVGMPSNNLLLQTGSTTSNSMLSKTDLDEDYDAEEIYLDEVIDDLCSVIEEKCGKTLGFHPKLKSQDEIDLKIGARAKFLYDALVHSENPSYEIIETAIRFMASLEFIEELKEIATKRTNPGIGLRPKQISPEDLAYGKRAYKLALEFTEDASDEVVEKVDEFLSEDKIIRHIESIADKKLNETNIGFEREPISKEDEQVGKQAELIAKAIKMDPSEQNFLIALKFIRIAKELDLMANLAHRVENKDRCMGYHCDVGEEVYTLAA